MDVYFREEKEDGRAWERSKPKGCLTCKLHQGFYLEKKEES